MDKVMTFYIIGTMILYIITICLALLGIMRVIFKYIREPWWWVASIIPTVIAAAAVATITYVYVIILAEIGVLP